ncbi:MAG TPA: NAD(P)/FAD-dependent oxidoreductase [Firmicutes bacterium]|jgi:predicted Rossmann fold flavoprotein|nr:NAD(P)/FAD-dependent oxidoreductase [Bacillota bacterium]
MSKPVVVIGAGAAGLIAAGFLAQRGAQVKVLEKMARPGLKLRISGKGRCNLTSNLPVDELISHYPGNGRFLYGALHRFSNRACMEFFAKLGVELKVERGQRVFPVSDDAHEIADALERFARSQGAEIYLARKVVRIELAPSGQIAGVAAVHKGEERFFPAENVIVATGGLSYPGTGSTGDGLIWARDLGHTIVEPRPALVPVSVEEGWAAELAGLSLRNVEFQVESPEGGRTRYFGELMFAHFGLTGPVVLTASEQIGLWLKESGRGVKAFIDLKPALSEEQLDQRLLRDFTEFSRKQFKNALDALLPKRLIPVVVNLSGVDPRKPCHHITREERTQLRRLLKGLPLTINRTLPIAAAIVTAGGVDVREVDPRTMESKKVKGLFFCGEVLDVHGVTGGFNLQAAFSTGYCAAHGVRLV